MDRYTVNTAKSQIGFIDFLVKPTFEVLKAFLPELQLHLNHLDSNKEIWNSKTLEYEEKLSDFF